MVSNKQKQSHIMAKSDSLQQNACALCILLSHMCMDAGLISSSRSQTAELPDQLPSLWHSRVISPTRLWPMLQKYVAINPPGTVALEVMSNPPFVGGLSIAQLTTRRM